MNESLLIRKTVAKRNFEVTFSLQLQKLYELDDAKKPDCEKEMYSHVCLEVDCLCMVSALKDS